MLASEHYKTEYSFLVTISNLLAIGQHEIHVIIETLHCTNEISIVSQLDPHSMVDIFGHFSEFGHLGSLNWEALAPKKGKITCFS